MKIVESSDISEVNIRSRRLSTVSIMEKIALLGVTSGFYKFLARFSGRRRITISGKSRSTCQAVFYMFILLLTILCNKSDACSSRTTPKPRPPTPTPRPNITFHTYKCPPECDAWYCLNQATCFTVKVGESLLYNCECAEGFMGPRCEYKDLDGTYIPSRNRDMFVTAASMSAALVALLLVTMIILIICRIQQSKKKEQAINGSSPQTTGDVVDSRMYSRTCAVPNQKRPFGPHHCHTISMEEALKR